MVLRKFSIFCRSIRFRVVVIEQSLMRLDVGWIIGKDALYPKDARVLRFVFQDYLTNFQARIGVCRIVAQLFLQGRNLVQCRAGLARAFKLLFRFLGKTEASQGYTIGVTGNRVAREFVERQFQTLASRVELASSVSMHPNSDAGMYRSGDSSTVR